MTEDIKNKLLMCAEMYHRADFIQSDPVQFHFWYFAFYTHLALPQLRPLSVNSAENGHAV